MGPLTESMTRLSGEIVAARGERLTFIRDLGQDVAAMRANLRRLHAEMARQGKAERQGFVKALARETAGLRADFRRAHLTMARRTEAARRAAVTELKMCVGGMCREFALDLAGARRAWFGPSPAERRAKADAERRAREAAERERQAAAQAKEAAAHPARPPEVKDETARPGKKKG